MRMSLPSLTVGIMRIWPNFQRFSIFVRVRVGIVVCCSLIIGLTICHAWISRNETLSGAGVSTRATVALLQQHVADAMADVEIAMSVVPRSLKVDGQNAADYGKLAKLLAEAPASLPMLHSIKVLDAGTRQVIFSFNRNSDARGLENPWADSRPVGLRLPGLHVSRPWKADGSQRWFVEVGRSGKFGGEDALTLATIELNSISHIFSSGDIGQHGTSTLYREDGIILARYPETNLVGEDFSRAQLFKTHLPKSPSGTYRTLSIFDNIDRIVSYRHLSGLGLIVVSTHSVDDVLANWSRATLMSAEIAGICCLLLILFGHLIINGARAGEVAANILRQKTRLLQVTLDNMDHGLLLVEAGGQISVSNRRLSELLGLDPAYLNSPRHRSELRRALVARGEFRSMDDEFQNWVKSHDVFANSQSYIRTRPDGTVLAVRRCALEGGGALRTYADITEQHRSFLELRNSQQRYRLLADNASDLIILANSDRAKVYISPAVEKMLGYSVAEATAMSMRDFVHPEDQAYVYKITKELCEKNPTRSITYRLKRKDGSYIWAEAALQRVAQDNGASIVLAIRDISQRKLAEIALNEKSSMLAATLENMDQGLLMVDTLRRVQICNSKAAELLGLSAEAMARRPYLHEVAQQELHNQLGKTAAGQDNLHLASTGDFDFSLGNYESERADGTVLEIRTMQVEGVGFIRTFTDITQRKAIDRHIAHIARHDVLTNLPNRLLLRERMEQSSAEIDRRGGAFAVLCLDLDRFKAVNDSLGHAVGDKLLQVVAERLRSLTRKEDIVARLGGDEFAIIQSGVDQPHHAAMLARRIVETISQPIEVNGHELSIGTSIGITLAPNDGLDPEALLKNADLALYRAKADGRNMHRFFQIEMDAAVETRRALEADLRQALRKNELEMRYQPVIDLISGEMVACEALLRWNHPARGMISPAVFIPLAEESRVIGSIGNWILAHVCDVVAQWPEHINVSVNLSAVQFENGNLVAKVKEALATSGLAPHRLELEITETVLMQHDTGVYETLRLLRQFGVRIALDDFGTGYSSLSYLRRFPLDTIKIDRSFVADIADAKTVAIIRAIVSLGKQFDMKVIAEGIETQVQWDLAIAEGCTHAQGYLFSRPLTQLDIEQRIGFTGQEAAA